MSSRHQIMLRLLRARRYRIPRYGIVLARLWQVQPRPAMDKTTEQPPPDPPLPAFAVELEGLGSRRFHLVGHDESHALAVWTLLVRNTVTPCALADVLEEISDTLSFSHET